MQPPSQYNFRNFCPLGKRSTLHINSRTTPISSTQSWATTGLLSIFIFCLFWMFYINGIVQYMVFVISFSVICSKFIHVKVCCFTLFYCQKYFIAWLCHILFIHLSVDGHFSCFHLWSIMNSQL